MAQRKVYSVAQAMALVFTGVDVSDILLQEVDQNEWTSSLFDAIYVIERQPLTNEGKIAVERLDIAIKYHLKKRRDASK